MLWRYLAVLCITILVYIAPTDLLGISAWVTSSVISLLYIMIIWHFSHIRARYIIIGIETLSKLFALLAFIQHYSFKLFGYYLAPESQWFWLNYEPIMSYCFLMEIVAIIIGIANSGEFKQILSVCLSYFTGDKYAYRPILFSDKRLCKNPQNIFRTR